MKNFWLKLKDIPASTIGRTIALILSIVNEFVAVIGAYSFAADSTWYPIVSTIVVLAVSMWTLWENNDFTWFGAVATRFFVAMNDGKLTKEEIDDIVNIIVIAERRHKDENR